MGSENQDGVIILVLATLLIITGLAAMQTPLLRSMPVFVEVSSGK